jgi:hypothetical protein
MKWLILFTAAKQKHEPKDVLIFLGVLIFLLYCVAH